MSAGNPVQEEHRRMTREFLAQARELGYRDLCDYYWYHTIDVGNGLVTPGVYDYRYSLEAFCFPESLRGMQVLDVGAATGFFSFEFEKRGGAVVSTELPSLLDIDKFPGESMEHTLKKLEGMMPAQSSYSDEQCQQLFHRQRLEHFYNCFLIAPFEFCRKRLNSQVTRRFTTVYNLSPETVGGDQFDFIFLGDVLLHTVYPLKALAAAARLCRGTLVLAQGLAETPGDLPVMLYVGGEAPGMDEVSWWWPNYACFEKMLKKLGFPHVELKGYHQGIVRPGGGSFNRAVIHASR
jgi:SAM-dependent methyltransferase